MFIERLINSGAIPAAEQSLKFTAARHKLLATNIANIDTDGYEQTDLNESKFQGMLAEKLQGGGSIDLSKALTNPTDNILFHDLNNRSPEQLMSDLARNGLEHNMFVEFLRNQFSSIEMALRERVS